MTSNHLQDTKPNHSDRKPTRTIKVRRGVSRCLDRLALNFHYETNDTKPNQNSMGGTDQSKRSCSPLAREATFHLPTRIRRRNQGCQTFFGERPKSATCGHNRKTIMTPEPTESESTPTTPNGEQAGSTALFAAPISDEDAKDIVCRLQWSIDSLKGARCECDLSVGYICETCGNGQLLVDARNEIQKLRDEISLADC